MPAPEPQRWPAQSQSLVIAAPPAARPRRNPLHGSELRSAWFRRQVCHGWRGPTYRLEGRHDKFCRHPRASGDLAM